MARAVAKANALEPKRSSGCAELHNLKDDPKPELKTDPKPVHRSTAKAAAVTGASGRAVAQAKRVVEKAPDLAEKVRAPLSRDKAAAVTGACGRRWRTARRRSAAGILVAVRNPQLCAFRTPRHRLCSWASPRILRSRERYCSPATYPTLSPGLLPAPTSGHLSSTPVPPGTTDRYRFCRR